MNYVLVSFINFQEKDTEKVLYGLDDINDADEVIIVTTFHYILNFISLLIRFLMLYLSSTDCYNFYAAYRLKAK